jgi:hypothetical protein
LSRDVVSTRPKQADSDPAVSCGLIYSAVWIDTGQEPSCEIGERIDIGLLTGLRFGLAAIGFVFPDQLPPSKWTTAEAVPMAGDPVVEVGG